MRIYGPLFATALVLATACVEEGDDPNVSHDTKAGIAWNGIAWNGIAWNGLTTGPKSVKYLIERPLDSSVYAAANDPAAMELRTRIADDDTREFFKYLVGCALPAGTSVKWKHPTTGYVQTFSGSQGFCKQWAVGGVAGDDACQEAVSACLLSLNNAMGEHVEVSQAGLKADESPVPMTKAVKAAPSSSTESCSSWWSWGDSNCNWRSSYVGTCAPGSSVTVLVGSCSGNMLARVCEDTAVCDKYTSQHKATVTGLCSRSSFTFTCPEKGIYNLPTRVYYSWHSGTVRLKPITGAYPADEREVWRFREMVTFGNMFTGNTGIQTEIQLDANGEAQKYVLYEQRWYKGRDLPANARFVTHRDMYVANSPEWDYETVYDKMRVCGGPSGWQCAATWVGNASSTTTYPDQEFGVYPKGACEVEDNTRVIGDGDYDNCRDDRGRVWKFPVTSWLKHPCDAQQYKDLRECLDRQRTFDPSN